MKKMKDVPKLFGCMVFSDAVMRQRLPKETYAALKQTTAKGLPLQIEVANVVARAMKEWAIEKGATHFTHWFQPMTGITAEKHDSFLSFDSDGAVIMEFSGKSLVQGESDASSFPSGGLRATFEARGYTAWDPTSYAFIKDGTLCIPTAFCSYGGEALDKKTPLLRSMEALDRQAMRILSLFNGNSAARVITMVGPEQEYFIIDKAVYEKRPDLIACGRTLMGARPSKGQELDDHYFGALKPRISDFMSDLDTELWKLGVPAKTKHNETSPAQHELAPIYSTTNIATDHNQLMMEFLKRVADRHGLVCLLHEKPFAGVNGSGKHNNWSIQTDTGVNLFEPGDTPYQNARFLLFLMSVIKAVDEYQDLLRISVASAGNDHRLGVHEAPPAIISVFLGEELTAIIEALEAGTLYQDKGRAQMEIGAVVLPKFPRDTTDRNRTSPFAFTGDKFEFRMPGSSFSTADINTVLNTIVAQSLCEFADVLENAENFTEALDGLVRDTIKKHKRIIFNGNNYSEEWAEEARARGLLNLKSTVDVLPYYTSAKNIKLFEKHGVFSESELHSRHEIHLEAYYKTIQIEALTMIDMTRRDILPCVLRYAKELAQVGNTKRELDPKLPVTTERKLLRRVINLTDDLYGKLEMLEELHSAAKYMESLHRVQCCRDGIVGAMAELRLVIDELETITDRKLWPYPTYAEILFSVK